MFQSVRQSAAFYKKTKKSKKTKQQELAFRWKFIVLGLGVILVILIGISSELIKRISSLKSVSINTTFLYKLLPTSQFLNSDLPPLKNMISGFYASDDIKFDNSTLLFSGYHTSGQSISRVISQQRDLLFLFELSEIATPTVIYKFGMVLHQHFPQINYDSDQNVSVADARDSLTSIVFSLNANHSLKLDQSDSCFIYHFQGRSKQLSFLQFISIGKQGIDSQATLKIDNSKCFSNDEAKSMQRIREIFGVQLSQKQAKLLNLNKLQIHRLDMNYINFEQVTKNKT